MSDRSSREQRVLERLLRQVEGPAADAIGANAPSGRLRMTPLSGGDINRVYRLDAPGGESFVVKIRLDAPNRLFEAEANGLEALRQAGALRTPKVYALDSEGLLMEWLAPAEASAGTQGEALGRGLVQQHLSRGDAYGFSEHNYIGALPQANTEATSWITFYREARLLPQYQLAEQLGRWGAERRRLGERLLERLPEWIDETQVQPSLLHGDLWGGNWLATDRGPALIDPAVFYGDREMDLAMSRLFGGFPERFYDAYDEAFPPAPGHRERVPIYQLYYLLVHLNLFGETYGPAVDRILRAYGG